MSRVILVDVGVLDEPLVEPDVTRREVAEAGGSDVERLAAARDRPRRSRPWAAVPQRSARRLYAEGRLDGIAALGGTGRHEPRDGAMRALPLGTPKLMVSAVAPRRTPSLRGATDLTMMYAVTDIAGINRISARSSRTRPLRSPPWPARKRRLSTRAKPLVGASMFGITMPCVKPLARGSRTSATRSSSSTRRDRRTLAGGTGRGGHDHCRARRDDD